MGFLTERATIVMNAERRFHVAREQVLRLSIQGYLPPPVRSHIRVLGRSARATMEAGAYQFLQGRYISEYDFHLASQLAYVMTGGDLTGPQDVDEEYLLGLEREVFVRLLGEQKTQDRITHLLSTGKPLRN
jgi:3-hydroxyacyl-CoA dehydrogenase